MDQERFKVVVEIKKFIEYVDEILINYPRKSYVLKDQIEKTSYELLELAYYTNLLKEREDCQKN